MLSWLRGGAWAPQAPLPPVSTPIIFIFQYGFWNWLLSLFQDHYGIDWQGPIPYQDETDAVEVPDTPLPVSVSDLAILQHLYPEEVILASEYHAIDTYCDVLYFVNERVAQCQ